MTKKKIDPTQALVLGDVTKSFEDAIADTGGKYELHLYVAGQNPRSKRAIAVVTKICEEHLAGRYTLEVVDIYQDPELGAEAQLIAAPTLIKKLPKPLRRLVGDMSNQDRVLIALNLLSEEEEEKKALETKDK